MRRQAFLIYSSTVNENRTTCACAGGYFRQKTLKIYPLGANKKPPKIPNTEFTLDSSSLAFLSGAFLPAVRTNFLSLRACSYLRAYKAPHAGLR